MTPCAISMTHLPSPRLSSSVTPRERYRSHQLGILLSAGDSGMPQQTQSRGLVVALLGKSLLRTEVKHSSLRCAWFKPLVIVRPDTAGRNHLFREMIRSECAF